MALSSPPLPSSRPTRRSPTAVRQRDGLPGALLVSALLMILGFVSWSLVASGEHRTAFDVALLFSSLTLLAGFVAEYRRTGNALSPMCLTMFLIAVYFPFHGAMAQDDPIVVQLLGADRYEYYTEGLLVVGLAAVVLLLGYRSGLAGRVARRMPKLDFAVDDADPRLPTRLAILYAAAVGARVLLYADGLAFHYESSLQESGQLIRFQFLLVSLSSLAPLVMLYVLATGLRMRRRMRVQVAIALLIVEVVWGLVSGSRLKMVVPIALVVLVLGDVWRKIKIRHLVVGILLFAFVLFPLVSAFRGAYFNRVGDIQRGGLSTEIITDSLEVAFSGSDDGYVGVDTSPGMVVARRAHGLTSLALIMRFTPERHDYLLGMPYLLVPVNILVPRAIWPDKPDVSEFLKTFRSRYWGLDRAEKTSVAVTLLGDFWVNLHLFGIIVGMFVFGAMLRYLREFLHLGAGRDTALRYALYASLLIPFMRAFEGTFDGFVAGTTKTMFLYMIATWFLARGSKKKKKRRRARARAR